MKDWRTDVLSEFQPGASPLTLVYDPDRLLAEQIISAGLRERGFEIIQFEDPLSFRYLYESRFRSLWDSGRVAPDLIVWMRQDEHGPEAAPWDVQQRARQVRLSLSSMFPALWSPLLGCIEPDKIDGLWRVYQEERPSAKDDLATRDYMLLHLYELLPTAVHHDHQLLAFLLRLHYGAQRLPAELEQRVVDVLQRKSVTSGWSIETLVRSRTTFLAFVQERWNYFIAEQEATDYRDVAETGAVYGMKHSGPAVLPFAHDSVRSMLDNYFAENLLTRIRYTGSKPLEQSWIAMGLEFDPTREHQTKLIRLLDGLTSEIPGDKATHTDWLQFAWRWAAVQSHAKQLPSGSDTGIHERVSSVCTKVEERFSDWMKARFAGLASLPPVVMVHQIASALTRRIADSKVALIVMDGLSLEDWLTLRSVLDDQIKGAVFDQAAVFTWVPTLTSVCRQSIFAGQAPYLFGESILITEKEPKLWQRLWQDCGVARQDVFYQRAVRTEDHVKALLETIDAQRPRVAGVVCDVADSLMHGVYLGGETQAGQLKNWAATGVFAALLTRFASRGYQVFIASDHGSNHAVGMGRLSDGALPDVPGARARIYPDENLRQQAAASYGSAIVWPSVGLPDGVYALLADNGTAFIREGEKIITHGGISISEVIVPFIEVVLPEGT